jgi:hypothetical protein
MKHFGNKLLTDLELVDIIRRAPDEIECADAYRHFMEDLAELVTTHFGGDVLYISGPVGANQQEQHFRCDNCETDYVVYADGEPGDTSFFIDLGDVENLDQRLTPGDVVPDGECTKCGAFVYECKDIDDAWVASIKHNECVPSNGWVYSKYDTDIDWNEEDESERSSS